MANNDPAHIENIMKETHLLLVDYAKQQGTNERKAVVDLDVTMARLKDDEDLLSRAQDIAGCLAVIYQIDMEKNPTARLMATHYAAYFLMQDRGNL